MANKEHFAKLMEGVGSWNKWVLETRKIEPQFRPDLSHAQLPHSNFRGMILDRVDFRGCDISYSILVGAMLRGADLSGTRLWWSDFRSAQLQNADLSRAALIGVDFSGTNLCGANFDRSAMIQTVFANTNLIHALNLETVRHDGPSDVGIETIYRSNGKIASSFLRGCGVPESFIAQMQALVGAEEGIQFYSCFISYSSKDEEFAGRLHGRMRDAHLRVWFAPEDIQGGQKLYEQIDTAIRVYDKLLIVLSEASLQSEWVMTEIRKARKHERQSGKRKLFPVRLVDFATLRDWECFDADSGKDLAVELREYFIPDFSQWKEHDQFEAAFARLLNDLRAEQPAK